MKLILFHILLLLLFLAMPKKSKSSQNSKYDECSKKFGCGDKANLGYPFYDGLIRPGYCGYPGFKIDCSLDKPPNITIYDQVYYLTNTDDLDKNMITLSRSDTWQGECPDRLTNTTMDLSIFVIPSTSRIVTFFYHCKGYGKAELSTLKLNTTCDVDGSRSFSGYYLTQDMLKANSDLYLVENCLNIFLLVSESEAQYINADPIDLGTVINAFRDGFDLELNANNEECRSCLDSNGVCGYNFYSRKFVCHCEDHDYSLKCGFYDKKGSKSSQNSKYDECSNTFRCGDKNDLGYPFYDGSTRPDYCGYPGFKLDCSPDNPPKITIYDQVYNLTNTDGIHNMITLSRNDTWQGECPDHLTNTTMDLSIFDIPSDSQNVTFFYNCKGYGNNDLSTLTLNATCDGGGSGSFGGYYLTQNMLKANSKLNLFENCHYINLIVLYFEDMDINGEPLNLGTVINALQDGFNLELIANNEECSTCVDSYGVCGYDFDSSKFVCHCEDHDYNLRCGVGPPILYQDSATTSTKVKTILVVGLSMGFVALLAIVGGCLLIIQKSKRNPKGQCVEDSLKNASLLPKRYSYKYIKKVTKSFREKLGEGGYGTVFKGSLKDGRVVAVKVWKQLKGDGQDFLNEVMSISRTSHINVVPLLGFCFEGHKRALIYEFMPNGSLEKFINGSHFNENNQPLSAQKLFDICVGIARGLEYLHRGCNTQIVHFDIKPHNILLDAEFIPKISDFGLAKSCQQKESLISMSEARGTIGYIAPEVFFRMYGGVSHKSDVYSFGMMILEMVGCKNKVHENAENSSEMYFPQWIYKQLEQGTMSINCERILNEEEKDLERKMILAGLWCIQTNPISRPSMNRVLEMLEGKVLMDVPPMPTLCTPPRQQLSNEDSASFLSSTTYAPTL